MKINGYPLRAHIPQPHLRSPVSLFMRKIAIRIKTGYNNCRGHLTSVRLPTTRGSHVRRRLHNVYICNAKLRSGT